MNTSEEAGCGNVSESTEYHGVCHSAHRMLGKLSYFKEGKTSKESLLSGLYLAVTV